MTELMRYFSYPFVRYAFAVGVMIALCAALIGVVWCLSGFPSSATDFRTLRSA